MDILGDMGVSKLSAEVFLKVNYSFNCIIALQRNHSIFILIDRSAPELLPLRLREPLHFERT